MINQTQIWSEWIPQYLFLGIRSVGLHEKENQAGKQ
jgi:hypothetical protein